MKKQSKLEVLKPKPRQARRTTSSFGPTKLANKPKSSIKPSDGEKKRKIVIFVTLDDEDIESDEAVKEVKAKSPKATKVAKEKPSNGSKSGKKSKTSELDEGVQKGKIEVKPPMSLDQIVNEVIKNGNLKPLFEWYGNFDESNKRTLEEAPIEYLNINSKALIELMIVIPKRLYDILDVRRHTTNK